jgi:hypothetical protein
MLKNLSFYIPTSVNIIGLLVGVYFILSDYTQYGSSSNGLLLLVCVLMGGWIALCFYLRNKKVPALGTILAWIPATPFVTVWAFCFAVYFPKPRYEIIRAKE